MALFEILGGIGLLGSLFGGKKQSVSYTDPSKTLLPQPVSATNAMNTMYSGYSDLYNESKKNYASLMRGELPTAFTTSINADVSNSLGNSILPSLAGRGLTLNNSSFRHLMGNSVQNAISNNLPNYLQLLAGINSNAMGMYDNFYNNEENRRYGTRSEPIVNPGSNPMGNLMGSLALGGAFNPWMESLLKATGK